MQEEYIGEDVVKDLFHIYIDTKANHEKMLMKKREAIKFYCEMESEKVDKLSRKLEIIERTWLNVEKQDIWFVDNLTLWEMPIVAYKIFVAPKLRDPLKNFVADEIVSIDKLYQTWFWNEALLFQYLMVLFYGIEWFFCCKRKKFFNFKLNSEKNARQKDADESSDESETDEDTENESTNDEANDENDESEDSSSESDDDDDDDDDDETDQEKILRLEVKTLIFRSINLGSYTIFDKLLCGTFNNFFSKRSFPASSFLVRGYKELRKSKGLKLNAFKNAYAEYCNKRGLKHNEINQKQIEKVCREFYIKFNKQNHVFECQAQRKFPLRKQDRRARSK